MKIRHGFVSNSSSSSFLVAFDFKPDWEDDLEKMLFGDLEDDEKWFNSPYSSKFRWRNSFIASIVMKELKHQKPMTKKQMIKEIRSGYFPGFPDFDYNDFEYANENDTEEEKKRKEIKRNKIFRENDRMLNEAANLCYEEFIKTIPDKSEIYVFEYSDDYELGCAMEHGNLFDRFQYLHISKH